VREQRTRRRRGLEGAALAIPILAGAGWLGLLAVSDDGGGPPEAVAVHAAGPTYTTLADLVAASDLVVVATVTELADGRTLTDPADPDAGIRTRLVTVEVSQVLAGTAPAPLVIEEEAALLDGTPIVVNGVEPSRRGDRGVYFLVAGGTADAPYHALVNEQGRYLVAGTGLRPAGTDALSQHLAELGIEALVRAIG
jgi:hypothetical protein